MSKPCAKHGHDAVCPYCEIDTLNAEVKRLVELSAGQETDIENAVLKSEQLCKALDYLIDKHLPANHLTDSQHRHFMRLLNRKEG